MPSFSPFIVVSGGRHCQASATVFIALGLLLLFDTQLLLLEECLGECRVGAELVTIAQETQHELALGIDTVLPLGRRLLLLALHHD